MNMPMGNGRGEIAEASGSGRVNASGDKPVVLLVEGVGEWGKWSVDSEGTQIPCSVSRAAGGYGLEP